MAIFGRRQPHQPVILRTFSFQAPVRPVGRLVYLKGRGRVTTVHQPLVLSRLRFTPPNVPSGRLVYVRGDAQVGLRAHSLSKVLIRVNAKSSIVPVFVVPQAIVYVNASKQATELSHRKPVRALTSGIPVRAPNYNRIVSVGQFAAQQSAMIRRRAPLKALTEPFVPPAGAPTAPVGKIVLAAQAVQAAARASRGIVRSTIKTRLVRPIQVVQTLGINTTGTVTATTLQSTAMTAPLRSPSMIVVFIAQKGTNSGQLPLVTDIAGNTYTQVLAESQPITRLDIFVASNVSTLASNKITVSVALTAQITFCALEATGVSTVTADNNGNFGLNGTTNPNCGGISTTTAAELLVIGFGDAGTIGGLDPAGYTRVAARLAGNNDLVAAYRIFSTPQTAINPTWTNITNNGNQWNCAAVGLA